MNSPHPRRGHRHGIAALVALIVALLLVPSVAFAGDGDRKRIKHTVRSGETLWHIAKKYGVSRLDVERWNKKRLDDVDDLHPGDRVVVYVDADTVDRETVRIEKKDAPDVRVDEDSDDASDPGVAVGAPHALVATGKSPNARKRADVTLPPSARSKGELEAAAAAAAAAAADHDHDGEVHGHYEITEDLVQPPKDGFFYPYSYGNLMRGFDGARCTHQGLDIGGVGDHSGVGTPIYAMVKAEVVFIGLPEDDPKKYGRRDKRNGHETRGGKKIPRKLEVEGYGTVYPFTRTNGTSRTGVFFVTRAIGGELDGHKVRYLHMAAVHPDLKVGDIVEAGQEVGLMGATGFKETRPHLHLDVEDESGVRVDPAPYIGLAELRPSSCKPINKHKRKVRYRNKGKGNGKRTRIYHEVGKGQTVSGIAKKYKVRSRDIVKWNKLKDADSLRSGQKLKVYVYR